MRRLLVVGGALVAAGALLPTSALAHGLVSRGDLPIPAWLFGWAAAAVLIVSFVALAALWKTPQLENSPRRPLGEVFSRIVTSPLTEVVCGTLGVALLGIAIWAGFAGVQSPADNVTPTFVYVIFWVALVPLSALVGNVFSAFNPWRAIGRAFSWGAGRAAGDEIGGAFPYPDWLGRWPAAAGLVAFAWLELASPSGTSAKTLAAAALVYTSVTFLGMGLFGVETWIQRGEAFSTYFGLFARMAVLERADDRIVLRRPLAGLTTLEPIAGTVGVLAVMIGTVTFDGGQETLLWNDAGPAIADFFRSVGAGAALGDELSDGVGLLTAIVLVAAFYNLGIAGARTAGGSFGQSELARLFVHSLVPIAFAYVLAHYLTFLLFQGQAMGFLISDPLGHGWNLFGTTGWNIDYGIIGGKVVWYCQVAIVVAGHVGALCLAHDRALVVYDDQRLAVRSQYWMLAIMIGFTSLALWLLSQANF